jgi:hypothetical protein
MNFMKFYVCPIPAGDDPQNYGDAEKVEFMRQLHADRKEKGIAISRFVRQINKAYSDPTRFITPAEYKRAEQFPVHGIALIDEYLLQVAYEVLNSTRVQNSPQDKATAHAMTRIAQERVKRGFEYFHMSEKLHERGVNVTEAEYRTAEQGMARHVNFQLIAETARILGIAPGELFE